MMVVLVTVCRLPSVLLRDASGDVQESDELERDANLSTRSAYIREGQRPHPQAGTPLHSSLLSDLFCIFTMGAKLTNSTKHLEWFVMTYWMCVILSEVILCAGSAVRRSTGLVLQVWRRSSPILSLRGWTTTISGGDCYHLFFMLKDSYYWDIWYLFLVLDDGYFWPLTDHNSSHVSINVF